MARVQGRSRSSVMPHQADRSELAMQRHRLGVALFLAAALGSFLLSIVLWFTDNRQEGVFVGLWVPSILAAGAFWTTAVTRA
jgi:hypothetical protein